MADEFDEEEVWATAMAKREGTPTSKNQKGAAFLALKQSRQSSPVSIPKRSGFCPPHEMVWATAMAEREGTPTARNQKGAAAKQGRQSSPVSIPKRSGFCGRRMEEEEEEEDGGGDVEGFCPPHEMVERRNAGRGICAGSVCEGAGRTLKGRDQRRVRDAVLTRTGFIE